MPDRPATTRTAKPAAIATARHVAAMISCRFSLDFFLGCKAASGGGGCRGAWTSPTHGARTTWVRASSGNRLRGAGVSASGPPRGALTGVDGAFEGATGSGAIGSRSPCCSARGAPQARQVRRPSSFRRPQAGQGWMTLPPESSPFRPYSLDSILTRTSRESRGPPDFSSARPVTDSDEAKRTPPRDSAKTAWGRS